MSWDHDGSRIEDDEEAGDRHAENHDAFDSITSGLDRSNLVWMLGGSRVETTVAGKTQVSIIAGGKLLLLARIATAGPSVCKLPIDRLARDCGMHPRTAERYRSSLVEDGILERVDGDKGRPASFRLIWQKVVDLAGIGLMRRPAKERVRIIDSTLRSLAVRNVLPLNETWLAQWSNPATPEPSGAAPGRFTRTRRKQTGTPARYPAPRHGIHGPRQGIPAVDTLPGPSEPESLNLNKEPEGYNGCPAGQPCVDRLRQFGFQSSYGGKPTLKSRTLELLCSAKRPVARKAVVDALGVKFPGEVQRVFKELCRAGLAKRTGHGRYIATKAARTAA